MRSVNLQRSRVEPSQDVQDHQEDGNATYEAVLDRFNATAKEKVDLIAVLRGIMENFVDRAFGIDPVQQATAAAKAEIRSVNPTASPRSHRPRGRVRRRRAPHANRMVSSSKRRRTGSCSRKSLP